MTGTRWLIRWTATVVAAVGATGAAARADILFNGVSQGSQATISNGAMILGSGAAAGVTVNGAGDLLTLTGGTISISGTGSVGIRALGGTVDMRGGVATGVDAGALVQGGIFNFSNGAMEDGVRVEGAGSLFIMTGGTVRDKSLVASNGGSVVMKGGTLASSRLAADGASSRVDLYGGSTSWLDITGGAAGHVYGTAFTVNGAAVNFGGGDEFSVPESAGFMAVTYPNQTTASFKLGTATGGTVTLHLRKWGDFEGDGDVDAGDFMRWQRADMKVAYAAADFNAWQAIYGSVDAATPAAAVVPEPAGTALIAAAALAAARRLGGS